MTTIPHDQLAVIKCRANVNSLVPVMKHYLPTIRHMFLCRRHAAGGVRSTEKMLKQVSFVPIINFPLTEVSPVKKLFQFLLFEEIKPNI